MADVTHETAVEALHEGLCRQLVAFCGSRPEAPNHELGFHADETDTVLAYVLGSENRETVLAALGMEQVGVDYCTLHGGVRNEDEHRCDFAEDDVETGHVGEDGEPRECVLESLYVYRGRPAARTRTKETPDAG